MADSKRPKASPRAHRGEIRGRMDANGVLRHGDERFRNLVETTFDWVWEVDENLVYTYCSPRVRDLLGYEPGEVLGKTPFDFMPREKGSGITDALASLLAARKPFTCVENTNHHKSGHSVVLETSGIPFFDVAGQFQGYRGISRDITRGRQAEESEKRYRRLVESMTDCIYTVKVESGRPVATKHSPGCVSVTGYLAEEYDADPYLWYRMVHEADRETVQEQAAKVLSGVTVEPVEHRIIHKDGTIRWVKNSVVSRFDKNGHLVVYDGLVTDITERKHLEEQLRHAQKMEAVGHLAGGVAHDFNNILTAIMGHASILQMKMKGDDPLKYNVEQILAASERAATLTQSLLAFSRKQVINLGPVDLNEVVRRVERLLVRLIGEDIELQIIPGDTDLVVMADSGQIEQVLMNLATNARDAMPRGGRFTIRTNCGTLDNEYIRTHGYGKPGTYALVTVTDTGAGMDEATRGKIFEPFFTTKEAGRGTGLGLSIVYGIVKQHNGYIDVYSEQGKGTTFSIYLPLTISEVEKAKPSELHPEIGGTETVLVAEDDIDERALTKEVLEGFGYRVIEAMDGEDTIRVFVENADRIDLIIIDVVMPKKNGKEVYEEIRKINPRIKAFFKSGYPPEVLHETGIFQEGLDIIFKPVSPRELLRKVRTVLDNGGR